MNDLITYKITHQYGYSEDARYFRSMISPDKMINILGFLDFALEEYTSSEACMDEKQVLNLLIQFYGVQEVDQSIIEPLLLDDSSMLRSVNRIIRIGTIKGNAAPIVEIDRYWARESCCGTHYDEFMKEMFPEDPNFINAMKKIEYQLDIKVTSNK